MAACGLGGGYVLSLGCSLVHGWHEGKKAGSGAGIWWAEAFLYRLKVMTDWRWVSELVRSSEMVEVHVC